MSGTLSGAYRGASGVRVVQADADGEDQGIAEQVSRQIFSTYQCRSIDRGLKHPGDIAEPASLRYALDLRPGAQIAGLDFKLPQARSRQARLANRVPAWSRSETALNIIHLKTVNVVSVRSAISLPRNDYPLWDTVGDDIVNSGKLSQLQLEGVRYACQKHLEILPSGQRAGFFIGDGAGVGKGRQISGARESPNCAQVMRLR
jgi:P-loop containing NTP hydrolase pore-1